MLELDISQIIIQIIAFLVMLWVMKRYGWQPLLDAMAARKKKIEMEFEAIAGQKQELQQLADQYEDKLRGIDAEARKKIQEAFAEGHKIQDHAQKQAREIVQQAKMEMENQVTKAKKQLKNEIVNLVVTTTEKVLQEKLDPASQKKLIAHFVEEAQLK